MTIHITNAQSIGSLVFEGKHKPFRALACPLGSITGEPDVAEDMFGERRNGKFQSSGLRDYRVAVTSQNLSKTFHFFKCYYFISLCC